MQLVIINGPCGVGKSTIASGLHQSIPLSLLVEIDAIRWMISHYNEHAKETSEYSYVTSFAMIDGYLKTGHSVIVEKMMRNGMHLDRMIEIAQANGAHATEIILWARKEFVLARAAERGYRKDSLLTPEKCERFWHEIDDLKAERPNAIVIDVEYLSPDKVVEKIRSAVSDTDRGF